MEPPLDFSYGPPGENDVDHYSRIHHLGNVNVAPEAVHPVAVEVQTGVGECRTVQHGTLKMISHH